MNDTLDRELAHLVGRVGLGDRQALRTLYERSAPRLYPVAMRLLRERALAEDVLQETFIAVWRQACNYRPDRGSVLAWLATLVRNKAVDLIRARPAHLPLVDTDDEGRERTLDAAHEGATPEQALLERCDDERLKACLAALDEAPRQALLLSFYGGLTHPELAERLAHPLGTVKAWIRRSLLRLQTCLEA
ncbi:MAG: sigma-70 family RNA polymerase sigma factor [Rhodocyclaceae bacterium]|nr:sigma-70 family RNA polymerase sigma factor [Rhodocyclaceae bacterium]